MAKIDPELITLFEPLDDGAKMVIGAGAKNPGSLMIVDQGSHNDAFCHKLAESGLAVAVDVSPQYPSGNLAGWRLTFEGAKTVIPLFGRK